MKRRFATILTFTVGLVLVAGIAYAAKKKDQIKTSEPPPDPAHEEEALRAELLAAAGDYQEGSARGGGKRAKGIVRTTGHGENEREEGATQTVKE